MLTGRLLRVRFPRGAVRPCYVDCRDPELLQTAEQILAVFRANLGSSRGRIQESFKELFASHASQPFVQGLFELLDDRCEFEVASTEAPELIREKVFALAAESRRRAANSRGVASETEPSSIEAAPAFTREAVLAAAGRELGLEPSAVDRGLFADLKSEQCLIAFQDMSAERLLERYNVGLAQAVLLRSTRVHVVVNRESPQRFRQLLRACKFHRLVCEVERLGPDTYEMHLDGPLSLFSATQKYGLQLALFLPTLLMCQDFQLKAELLWGPARKPKLFHLSSADGLVSHQVDRGIYVPPELGMFVELFRKRTADWEISQETEILPIKEGFWVPDFRLTHRATGRQVYLEVLGFWRRSSLQKHLVKLREFAAVPFVLAVSEQLRVDEEALEGIGTAVHRFRQMPLPDEIVRLAAEVLGLAELEPSASRG